MAEKQKTTDEEPQEETTKVNRREFLNLAWLASLGILAIDLGVVTYFFAMPRFREGEFGGKFSINKYDLPEINGSPVERADGRFWLAQTEEGVLALYKVCTHLGCLYGWVEEEDAFRCPCHGSQFFANGDWKLGPAPRDLDRFAIQVVDPSTGEVVSETDPETGAPVPVPDNPDVIISVDTGNLLRGQPK